jgi:hypothetical protein
VEYFADFLAKSCSKKMQIEEKSAKWMSSEAENGVKNEEKGRKKAEKMRLSVIFSY